MMMTVISTFIKCTIAGSVIVLAVLLLRAAFRSGLPKRFVVFLWLFAFAAFLVPVSISLPPALSGAYSAIIPPAVSNVQNTNSTSSTVSAAGTSARPHTDKQGLRPIQQDTKSAKASPAVTRPISGTAPNPVQIIFILYLCISATLAILFTALYLRTVRRFRAPVIVRGDLPCSLQKIAGVRQKVLFGLSDQTNVPVAAGLFRPKVILPTDFDLAKEALASHILLHELVHIKHHDSAVNLAALYVVCLHWVNPFAWLAWFLLGRDMEFACDSTAVRLIGYQKRSEYAQSLLFMASKKKKVLPLFVPALGKYGVKERVTNVMRTKRRTARVLTACILSLLLVGTSYTAVSCTRAAPAAKISGQATAQAMPKMMKLMLGMPKQKLADSFSNLDLCLGESLYFTDSKNISSETFFTFFSYIVNLGDSIVYPRDYGNRWFSKKDQQYHVPVADIVKVLNRYFVAVKFDPTKILGYNKKTGKIDRLVDGFGGARFPRMAGIKRISRDTLKITVNYCNMDDSKKIEYSVAYTVRCSDTGYKFLSIIEN